MKLTNRTCPLPLISF